MSDTVLDQVRSIVADTLNCRVDQVSAESSPDTLENWDSVQHLNLVLAVESRFSMRFDPWEAADLVSVGAIVRAVQEKQGSTT
ncbi:MAG: acyl carrier protein [Myxococcota bacterium]